MAKTTGMSDADLAALLDGQINDAIAYDNSDLATRREKALDYFEGRVPDVPSMAGRSAVVSRDVADVHGLVMPGLLRVFLATDTVAIFEPRQPEDEKFAKQATDYVNYTTLRECDGYRQLRAAISDALLLGNGVLKHWWDPTKEYSVEDFTGLSDDAYTQLVADDEVEEVLEHSEYPDPSWSPDLHPAPLAMGPGGPAQLAAPGDPPLRQPTGGPSLPGGAEAGGLGPSLPGGASDPGPLGSGSIGGATAMGAPGNPVPQPEPLGANLPGGPDAGGPGTPAPALGAQLPVPAPQTPLLHDCKIKRVCSYGRLRFKALAPEQFLIDSNAIALDEDHVRFAAHRYRDTRSSLIKQGYDEDVVNGAPLAGDPVSSEENARADYPWRPDSPTDKSTELVDVFECYIQVDADGDGVAEWRKVVMVGGAAGKRSVVENEEWGDDLPFSDIVPDPVAHRWRGRSIFDEVEDIQRIKTVLLRQLLDNTYLANNPRQIADLSRIKNPDVLAEWKIGDTLYVDGNIADAVVFEQVPSIGPHVAPVLEMMDAVVEKRTGISKATMALDMDALQNQTATATNAAQAAAHTKIEEYARNIAECGGLQRFFKCLLKLVVKHQDRPRTIRLRGEWVEMDPRAWNAGMDVSINTGLGSGSRDRDMQMLMGIKAAQELVFQVLGPSNPLVGIDNYSNTLTKLTETAGIRAPDLFFREVAPETVQQFEQQIASKPDPKQQELQAKGQLEMQKLQAMQQIEQAKAERAAQVEMAKIQVQQQAEQAKAERDAQIEQQRTQADHVREQLVLERQAAIEERQAQADIAVKQSDAQSKAQLEAQKFEFQKQMELLKFNLDRSLKVADMKAKQEQMMLGGRMDMAKAAMDQQAKADPMISGTVPEEAGRDVMEFGPSPIEHMRNLMSHVGGLVQQLTTKSAPKSKRARKTEDGSWVVEELSGDPNQEATVQKAARKQPDGSWSIEELA